MRRYLCYCFTMCYILLYTNVNAKDVLIVSIAPQAYFLRHIVEDTQDVDVLLPDGADPHTFEPSMKLLQKLSHAKIFFTIGIGLEQQWKQRLHAIAPSVIFIPSYVERPALYSLQKRTTRAMHTTKTHTHHAHDTPHFEEQPDGTFIPVNQHVWTSPTVMYAVVEQMLSTLIEYYPQHREQYTRNATALLEQIDALDNEIRNALRKKHYRTFLSYHPSWGYFANEYQLHELVIEENEREPSAKAMARLIRTAKKHTVRLLLTQPQFSHHAVNILSSEVKNLVVVNINPLQEDWFSMMNAMKTALEKYLQ